MGNRNDFNSRPSARGDKDHYYHHKNTYLFQFTPLREGRLALSALPVRLTHFNSRPSARGDTHTQEEMKKLLEFQFTPLREGRPQGDLDKATRLKLISIHAPPRGATRNGCF